MSLSIEMVAKELNIPKEEIERKSLQAFLLDQLRKLEADMKVRCVKWNVTSLGDMEKLIEEGKVVESDILDDFHEVDYLSGQIRLIKEMIDKL